MGSYYTRGYATSNMDDNPRWDSGATGNSTNDAASTGSSVFGITAELGEGRMEFR